MPPVRIVGRNACFYPRLRAGGDEISARASFSCGCFYPRLRAGGDVGRSAQRVCQASFLSTPPRGRRLNDPLVEEIVIQFLSTPPRGRRRRVAKSEATRTGFYPRLRAGGDLQSVSRRAKLRRVSIHASAREATERIDPLWPLAVVSIHASAREATKKRLPVRI